MVTQNLMFIEWLIKLMVIDEQRELSKLTKKFIYLCCIYVNNGYYMKVNKKLIYVKEEDNTLIIVSVNGTCEWKPDNSPDK